jgi:hypothetical protein
MIDFYDNYGEEVWMTDIARFGIDVWMTTSAIVEGKSICQAYLGAKIHDIKDPLENLGPMFRQVVYPIFELMENNETRWRDIRGSLPIPTYGESIAKEPEAFSVDLRGMIENFKEGFKNISVLWEKIINPQSFAMLQGLTKMENMENFLMPTEDWAKIVFDFAATFHRWKKDRKNLIDLMRPLYYARIASFINRTKEMTTAQAEKIIEEQAKVFEELKPYLLEVWDKD